MNVGSFDLDPMKNFSRKIILNDDDEARGVQADKVLPKNEEGRKFAASSTVVMDGGRTTLVSVPDTIIPVVSAHDERILPLCVPSPVSRKEKNRSIKRSREDDALHNTARKGRESTTRYYSPVVVRSTPTCTRNDDAQTQPRVEVGRDPPGRKYQYQYVSHQSHGTLH